MPAKKTMRLQVPLTTSQKKLLDEKSSILGFSSSTDTVKFLIQNFLIGSINISVSTNDRLSKLEEKETLLAIAEIQNGNSQIIDPFQKDFHNTLLKFADE